MNSSKHRSQFFELIRQPDETYDDMGYFTTYYLSVYDQHKGKKWFLSWNWSLFSAAFMHTEILWFLYRRMYLFAFLIGVLGHTAYTILSYRLTGFFFSFGNLFLARFIHWIFESIFIFSLSVSANALYFHFIRQKIAKGFKSKGVNPIAPVLYILFQIWLLFFALPNIMSSNPQAETIYKTLLGIK